MACISLPIVSRRKRDFGRRKPFPMNPEDRARQDIDRQLVQCGWVVQDKCQMNISAALEVAVREFLMLSGEVDYLLYFSGKAIGVIEAKPKGHPLIGVETQGAEGDTDFKR